ncbi:MAG TPA: hypothetical protein VFB75_24665 [Burkholderiales bacterium]|nr:hypothetical protein [Burkholderiales bacterium]
MNSQTPVETGIVARLALDSASPVANTPQAFAQELRNETAKWAQVIKDANITM